jgi:hypothetical protein
VIFIGREGTVRIIVEPCPSAGTEVKFKLLAYNWLELLAVKHKPYAMAAGKGYDNNYTSAQSWYTT